MRRRFIVVLLILSAVACGHGNFQYRATGAEAARIEQTAAEFAAATRGDESARLELDLPGRQALLDLLREGLSGALKEPDRDLVMGLVAAAGGPGTAGRPFSESELETSAFDLAAQLAAGAGLSQAEARALAALLGAPERPNAAQREKELRDMIGALELQSCTPIEPRVSYRGQILEHVKIPGSDVFKRWRKNVSSLHLVSVQCQESTGILLMSEGARGHAMRVLAWQFFDPDVWPAVAERLRAALKLPATPPDT